MTTSDSLFSRPEPHSLPTPVDLSTAGSHRQPNRQRRGGARVRVTRACDRCKRRKIKCNGTKPCDFCHQAKASCKFESAYARGRIPSIPTMSDPDDDGIAVPRDDMLARRTTLSATEHHHYEPILPRPEGIQHQNSALNSENVVLGRPAEPAPAEEGVSTSAFAIDSSRASPEPAQTDFQGHYIGPASGVSFLLRVQKRLHQATAFSEPNSIFTFGDAPLHQADFDPSFCMMLPREDAQRLVNRYFEFAMPTYRFLHRPTIQEWVDEFYDTLGIMRDTQNAPAKVALLFMVFSLARVYMPDDDRPGPPDLSARYYSAAEHQLAKERGAIRLTSVQARLTQCYYLLTQSRINHCWSLFGTVSRLALAIGLNRNRFPDVSRGLGFVETECRRRTFWCAYTLDTYLSAALGRPRSFHDDDIDTDLPACLEDHDLTKDPSVMLDYANARPSTMLAPLAHMKIARIIGRILRDLYSIKPVSAARRREAVNEISRDLSDWRAELSRFLDADPFSTSLLISIFQRQRNVLNLTYWHATILLHRPFILTNFARLSPSRRHTDVDNDDREGAKQCLDAAMKTVCTIDDITQNRQLFRSLWITAYFAFNATIMLYIFVIQERDSPPDVYSDYFSAATRCQHHLLSIAEKGSLSERYCLVLEELRLEAIRQTERSDRFYIGPNIGEGSSENISQDIQMQQQQPQQQSDTIHVNGRFAVPACRPDMTSKVTLDLPYDAAGFPVHDFSGWDYFNSMVSSGLGNLDGSLNLGFS